MKLPHLLRAGVAGMLLSSSSSTLAVEIWTTDSLTRVKRYESARPGAEVSIAAARGEWESFQIILSGERSSIKGLRLHADVALGPEGSALPPPRVFWQHYVTVSQSTPMSPLPPGDYPDALLPMDLGPPSPISWNGVGNQPLWIDIFVPYTTPPGRYQGSIDIQSATGDLIKQVPYSVEVHPFDLPVVPSLRTSFGLVWRRIAEAHGFDRDAPEPSEELARLIDSYALLLAEHRLSVDQIESSYPDGVTGELDETEVERALRDHLLHRHASAIGLPIWPDWPFGDPLGRDREAAKAYVARWMGLLTRFRASDRGYVIMGDLDEPNDADAYEIVREWGAFFNEVETEHDVRVPLLITEQPTPDKKSWGRLDGAPDIWVPHFSSVWDDMEAPGAPRDIAKRLAAGDEIWTYAALVQIPESWEDLHGNPKIMTEGHPPVWALDYPAINHRILGWLLPLHGLTGLAYWDMLYFEEDVDPWLDAGVFHHPSGDIYNGDGFYIYPATKERFGVHQPVASLRLKWIRDAAEDYDYLMLAKELGLADEARRLTHVFAKGFGDWRNDVEALQLARIELAKRIRTALERGEESTP